MLNVSQEAIGLTLFFFYYLYVGLMDEKQALFYVEWK